jgi:hypothetical protein
MESNKPAVSTGPSRYAKGVPRFPFVKFVCDGQKYELRPISAYTDPLVMSAHDALVPRSYLKETLVQRLVVTGHRRLLGSFATMLAPRRAAPKGIPLALTSLLRGALH